MPARVRLGQPLDHLVVPAVRAQQSVALGGYPQVSLGLGPVADQMRLTQHRHDRPVLVLEPLKRGLGPADRLTPVLARAKAPRLDVLREPVERVQWNVARRTLELGCNVILDWGLWSREERDRYRLAARELGVRVALCLVEATREELFERLSRRNAAAPHGTFHVSEARLDQSIGLFERPEEIALFDVEAL